MKYTSHRVLKDRRQLSYFVSMYCMYIRVSTHRPTKQEHSYDSFSLDHRCIVREEIRLVHRVESLFDNSNRSDHRIELVSTRYHFEYDEDESLELNTNVFRLNRVDTLPVKCPCNPPAIK